MDLIDLIRIAVRRWHVVVPVAVVTVFSAYVLADRAEVDYVARGSLLLTVDPAGEATNSSGNHPLLQLDSSLRVVGTALVQIVDSTTVRAELGQFGAETDYELGLDRVGPIIGVRAETNSSTTATRTVRLVAGRLQDELIDLQTSLGAPSSDIQMSVLALDEDAVVVGSNADRVVITIVGLGGICAMALALALEGVDRRRREEQEASTAPSVATTLHPPAEQDSSDLETADRGAAEETDSGDDGDVEDMVLEARLAHPAAAVVSRPTE